LHFLSCGFVFQKELLGLRGCLMGSTRLLLGAAAAETLRLLEVREEALEPFFECELLLGERPEIPRLLMEREGAKKMPALHAPLAELVGLLSLLLNPLGGQLDLERSRGGGARISGLCGLRGGERGLLEGV